MHLDRRIPRSVHISRATLANANARILPILVAGAGLPSCPMLACGSIVAPRHPAG